MSGDLDMGVHEGQVDGEASRVGTGQLPPARTLDRIHVLDVFRGIALLGMFLVHFSDFSSGGSGIDKVYQKTVALLFEERFWTMFGMLFGVGFAIQFRRADARGESFLLARTHEPVAELVDIVVVADHGHRNEENTYIPDLTPILLHMLYYII